MKIPKHPAIVIRREYVQANGLTYKDIENCTGIRGSYLADVLRNKKYLCPIDAIRLARFFGKTDKFFLLLQAHHQAAVAMRKGAKKLKQVRTLSELKTAIRKERTKVIRRPSSNAEEQAV